MNDTIATRNVLEVIQSRVYSKRSTGKARSPGRSLRHPITAPTLLTDERFMSRTQREAYRQGIEIWV